MLKAAQLIACLLASLLLRYDALLPSSALPPPDLALGDAPLEGSDDSSQNAAVVTRPPLDAAPRKAPASLGLLNLAWNFLPLPLCLQGFVSGRSIANTAAASVSLFHFKLLEVALPPSPGAQEPLATAPALALHRGQGVSTPLETAAYTTLAPTSLSPFGEWWVYAVALIWLVVSTVVAWAFHRMRRSLSSWTERMALYFPLVLWGLFVISELFLLWLVGDLEHVVARYAEDFLLCLTGVSFILASLVTMFFKLEAMFSSMKEGFTEIGDSLGSAGKSLQHMEGRILQHDSNDKDDNRGNVYKMFETPTEVLTPRPNTQCC